MFSLLEQSAGGLASRARKSPSKPLFWHVKHPAGPGGARRRTSPLGRPLLIGSYGVATESGCTGRITYARMARNHDSPSSVLDVAANRCGQRSKYTPRTQRAPRKPVRA